MMTLKSVTCLVLGILIPVGGVFAADSVAGEQKAVTCAACHGAQGVSTDGNNPILAGQYRDYLIHALQGYRDGSRQNAIMNGMAATLSDEDIADLAAYFSSMTTTTLQTAPRP